MSTFETTIFLAQKFSASVNDFHNGRQQLRLMRLPVYCLGEEDGKTLDGALFSFAEGANPEIVISIKARRNKAGDYAWHYAPARMSSRECELRHEGEVVWTLPQATFRLPEQAYPKFVSC